MDEKFEEILKSDGGPFIRKLLEYEKKRVDKFNIEIKKREPNIFEQMNIDFGIFPEEVCYPVYFHGDLMKPKNKIVIIGINPGKIKAFLRKELSSLIGEKRRDKEHWLKFFREDIKNCFMPKCGWCGKIATTQTVKGKNAQENNNRPLNWGYYCKSCYAKGLKEEEEAMYG